MREPAVGRGVELPELADAGTLPAAHGGPDLLGRDGVGEAISQRPTTDLRAVELELAGPDGETVTARLSDEAIRLIGQGASVLVYTALDPETDRGSALDSIPGGRHRVGQALGRIVRSSIAACGLKRAIIAGGDTSSHALGELDIHALTTRFPLQATPGSPLCLGHSADARLDGIEIAMKGGQVGGDDYFVALRDGLT